MKTIELFVGSNNDTKQLELTKIETILARNHEGFTISQAVGYWLGVKETTAVIVISDNLEKILTTIEQLKVELAQDAIAYHEVKALKFA